MLFRPSRPIQEAILPITWQKSARTNLALTLGGFRALDFQHNPGDFPASSRSKLLYTDP